MPVRADGAPADACDEPCDLVVKLIPRGVAGNVVMLKKEDVTLAVTDGTRKAVGTSSVVSIEADGTVLLAFHIPDSEINSVDLILSVYSRELKKWRVSPLVSDKEVEL